MSLSRFIKVGSKLDLWNVWVGQIGVKFQEAVIYSKMNGCLWMHTVGKNFESGGFHDAG